MEKIRLLIKTNIAPLVGMIIGLPCGYLYWYLYGIYDGTFYLSSEWWVNCVYGLLFGGLIGSLFSYHGGNDRRSDRAN